MSAHKDRLIRAADLLGMSPDDLLTKLDPPAPAAGGHTATPETEDRLTRLRRMAHHARNGHPIDVPTLANEFLTLDAQLSAGAIPPEAWREGPDAPPAPGETWGWFADAADTKPVPGGMQVYAHWSLAHDGVNVEIDAPDGLPLTVHVNDWEAVRLVIGTDEPFSDDAR